MAGNNHQGGNPPEAIKLRDSCLTRLRQHSSHVTSSLHLTAAGESRRLRSLPANRSVLAGPSPPLMYAAALPGGLRSADAIHLATAIRLQSDFLVAYDAGLLAAAVDAGLNVLAPGSPG